MEPYDIPPLADPFAASRAAFEQLTAELAAPATAWPADHELEELLDDRGRKPPRQLLQDHLDLRAAREERAVTGDAAAGCGGVAGADGVARRRVKPGHRRLLSTIVGTVTVRRCAFRAAGIVKIAAMDPDPGPGEGGGRGVRAGEAGDLMARTDELGNKGGAEPAGRASDKNAHA